ncbi:MAG TPA: adenylyltransferase/cytidyltransferase family protein, partial [Candidatus Omnitrophota bacterium]|nr:adenylyltransferase/cytidyltransferase family protein [Candidatus Omnitrophota bacterium]
MSSESSTKICSRRSLSRCARRLRRSGKRIVFTNGCFDILHAGHVHYLEQAKRLGNFLVVGLNSDRSVRKLKGRGRPVSPEKDRARVLAALSCVDCVSI